MEGTLMGPLWGRGFRLLYGSMSVSAFAHTFGTFIISWFVYEITGSELAMGGLWLISIGTRMLVQFAVGPYIDRFRRTRVMVFSESIRVTAFLGLLVLAGLGELTPAALYIGAFLISVVFFDAAAQALLPKLVTEKALVKANARVAGFVQIMRLLALPLAGVFVAAWGSAAALACVTVLFLISAVMAGKIQEDVREREKGETGSWWSQFKRGVVIYRKHPVLLFLGFFIAVINFAVFATQVMYIPYVVEVLGGSSFAYGLFAAMFPLGYVAGSYIVGGFREPARAMMYALMIGALFAGGLTHIGLGLVTVLWAALLIEAAAGLVMPVWNVYSNLLYQKLVPDRIRGQVFTVRFLIATAATPLGVVYGTFWATRFDLPSLFISVGVLSCVLTLVGLCTLAVYYGRRRDSVTEIKKIS
ncbi:MFS transporter [Alteribacter natronophilus]|uniref:MFS transporter n=1 Tax=Alteribacter natronophilus TaxID=2583810 RepID=UPI0014870FFA|nr:MFS transporter [Alteribacter natronophilus]TMW71422.1 MFS transporter [Alteribacter natronophilus]